jgi:hypothetical protein
MHPVCIGRGDCRIEADAALSLAGGSESEIRESRREIAGVT